MNVVLGAGMAGIGAYYADKDIEIYEQDLKAGGLCANFVVGEGFRFDRAVHLSFTNNQVVRDLFDKTLFYAHKPIPYSWFHERWLQHPAQNNLFPLQAEEKVEAIKSFVNRKELPLAENFEEWNKSRYGDYLWEHLFEPYNKKYWCVPLNQLSVNWIGNRIYQPTLEEVLYGSYTNKTPNTYYAKEMRYPVQGGYFAFVKDLVADAERRNRIHYNKKVQQISVRKKRIYFTDGEVVNYDKLLSSIPLPRIIDIIDEAPLNLREKAKNLEHTGVVLVSVGLEHCNLRNKMWFYIYDADILASRAYMPSAKAKSNAPDGCSSIQFEIYFNCNDSVPDKNICIKNTLYAIEKLNIAKKTDVLFTDYRVLDYGNVIFKLDTERITGQLVNWLQENEIMPIGRFGKWEYLWSDQAFMSGYNEMKKLIIQRKH